MKKVTMINLVFLKISVRYYHIIIKFVFLKIVCIISLIRLTIFTIF